MVTYSESIVLRLQMRAAETYYGVVEPGLETTLQLFWYENGELQEIDMSPDCLDFLQYPQGLEDQFSANLVEAGKMGKFRLLHRGKRQE